ncbi:MAG: polysaccharide deacetylase family protein [Devosia sp.]
MSFSRFALSLVVLGAVLAGCAKPPADKSLMSYSRQAVSAEVTGSILTSAQAVANQPMPGQIFSGSHLGGRTLAVSSTADIILRPGEVVLTFDDGPRAGKTNQILATLDQFGVKATFLMLGSAAQAHPELAQQVALHGNTVGSHTFDHVDLSSLSRQEALNEIAKGERAVAQALAGVGKQLSPFFRFPYLSQTGFLRTNLMQGSIIVLDVDIDSKDYYKDSPDVVTERTLARLDQRGSGIILFHDIHQRTVALLPDFLTALEQRGYSVVRLVPKNTGVFGRDVITADAADLGE